MDIGISYWFGYPSMPNERIALIKQSGFEMVSLHWTDEYENVTGSKRDVLCELQKNNIRVSSFHLSFEKAKYIWKNEKRTKSYYEDIIQAIYDAREYNIPNIVMHTDGKFSIEGTERLKKIIELSSKFGIFLCFENLQKEDNLNAIINSDIEDGYYLCYDTGHDNIRKCPFAVEYNRRIKYVHINDNQGFVDEHFIPKDGTVDWKIMCKNIRTIKNIDGILEVHNPLDSRTDAEKFLDKAYRCKLDMEKQLISDL